MTEYENLKSQMRRAPALSAKILLAAWTTIGLIGLLTLVWVDPITGSFLSWALRHGAPSWFVRFVAGPMIMAVRGILMVEIFGYGYHRFFQHLGFLTRQAQVFRRNQMFHWVHHMVIYPIGRFYKKNMPYVDSEDGIAWSWVAPALLSFALALIYFGVNVGSFSFIAAIAIYSMMFVERAHQRFHIAEHPWMNSPYFQWLEKIHILHHWDQRMNFTIIHPMMDMLFGTYLSPDGREREIEISMADEKLTVSDLINWRYLLLEADPVEYAAFISQARRHPRSVRKLEQLLSILREQAEKRPADLEAKELCIRAEALGRLVRPSEVAAAAA